MTPRCPHCHAITPPLPSKFAQSAVLTVAWLLVVTMAFAAAVIGPFIMVVLPFLALACVGVVAAAYEYAHGDRICAACGRAYEVDGAPMAAEPRQVPVAGRPSFAA
jgi:hypothetical protein